MRRVMPPGESRAWFAGFLPGAARGEPRSLFAPATVTDRADPQLVHLDGLDLRWAWCLGGDAADLPEGDPVRAALAAAADRHVGAAPGYVASGGLRGRARAGHVLRRPAHDPGARLTGDRLGRSIDGDAAGRHISAVAESAPWPPRTRSNPGTILGGVPSPQWIARGPTSP